MKELIYPYFITRDGRIWNEKTERYLKAQPNPKGYLVVRITVDKVKHSFKIHREVAKAFIPNPDNKPQVNHIDGNKNNNTVENLEWCTNEENTRHAIKNGLWKNVFKASQTTNEARKKKIKAVNIETKEEITFDSIAEAERYFDSRHITDVLKGKRSHAKGYNFFYL